MQLTTIFAILLAAFPSSYATPKIRPHHDKKQCPNNQVTFKKDKHTYCCPGKVSGEIDNAYCCVGAADVSASSTVSQTCSTTIHLTESKYSSLAQAAATSLSSARSTESMGAQSQTTIASSTSKAAAAAAAVVTGGPMAGALMAVGGLVLAL